MSYIYEVIKNLSPFIELIILATTIEKIWLIAKDIEKIKKKLDI